MLGIVFLDCKYGFENNNSITIQKFQPDFNEAVVKLFNLVTVRIIGNCVHAGMNMN